MNQQEPKLEVGIVSGVKISFHFPVPFKIVGVIDDPSTFCGNFSAEIKEGLINFEGKSFTALEFEATSLENAFFELFDVSIGIGFHWERTERQVFEGNLKFIIEGEKITAVNRIPLESYLISVISSEMSAKASAELLKAHAVISRSWLLSQILQKGKNQDENPGFIENETERIRWYDREDHANFDVCADDHCQRYQGITRSGTPQVREAIQATRGKVLSFGEEICDARFSKCCGGMLEEFQNCWENSPKPYLIGLKDVQNLTLEKISDKKTRIVVETESKKLNEVVENNDLNKNLQKCDLSVANSKTSNEIPDLHNEENARKWILGSPSAFCNTSDKSVLQQVLNGYDQETADFYRWKVFYTTEEISQLIYKRSGIDFGEIMELIPLERGVSSRIIRLKIIGSKKSLIIGKELEIRRSLSTSHLYSSAFVVEKTDLGFTLYGAGWGHGVGLCQIGAAVMGEKGYLYEQILSHYYPKTTLKKLYE
jgi:stage II sporulation protein D